MMAENVTILNLGDFPDIELEEFRDWFMEKNFKKVVLNNDRNWYKGKYDVDIIISLDNENKKFSMEI